MHISKLELAAIAIATGVCCVMVVGLMLSADFRESAVMVPAMIGLGLAIVGLLLAIPKPKAGLWVGLAGIGLAFLTMWWLFPFYLPVPIALALRFSRGQNSVAATTGA